MVSDEEKTWCPIARAVCVDGFVLPNYGERYLCAMTEDGMCLMESGVKALARLGDTVSLNDGQYHDSVINIYSDGYDVNVSGEINTYEQN